MVDREKVIRGTEICLSGGLPQRCIECPYHYDGCDRQRMIDTLEVLKEQPKWHVFHKCELTEEEKQEQPTWEWIMRCDCTPCHGDEFLLYMKEYKKIVLDHWDDDMWAEYACTMDGTGLDDGDAWMELPKPPEENCNG